jgi:protein-tyrosine phosphatase
MAVTAMNAIEKTSSYTRCLMEFSHMSDGSRIVDANNRNSNEFLLDRRLTSEQDPYRVVDIAYIVANPANPNLRGRLSVSMSPGKKDSKWNRNLQLDLNAIKASGVQVIVCLLEWAEMRTLGISDYPRKAQESGFLFYHLPIRDRGVPQQREINVLVPILVQHLAAGQNILVHCRVGLGRAGTICACCLSHFGYEGDNAIETVRKLRPGAIQTDKQRDCVIQYSNNVLNGL